MIDAQRLELEDVGTVARFEAADAAGGYGFCDEVGDGHSAASAISTPLTAQLAACSSSALVSVSDIMSFQ